MKKRVLATGFVLFSFLLPLKATAASFDRIYTFGDSLSDTGNLYNLTGFPPSPPYYQGRFSNGPVWVEYLAEDLGLNSEQQINYAVGGATTGSENPLIPGVEGLPGLQQQIDSYKAANAQADPDALYVVWAGANDYLGAGVTNPVEPVSNLSTAVSSLADYGAKNFLVVNLPDLGKLPVSSGDSQTSSELNALTGLHNSGLNFTSDVLSQEADINITYLDVNSLFNQAIAQPEKLGLTNVTDACLTEAGVCSNPDQYLFWDDIHPTTNVHKSIGEFAASTLESESVPEPAANLGVLALSGLGAVSMLKRKQKKASRVKAKV